MMKRQAQVTLRQESIRRLFAGKAVTIRLEDIELELRFDSLARIGNSGSLEDLAASILRESISRGKRSH